MMEGWTQIMPELIIPCCDTWPAGALTPVKMQAYKALADEGSIRIKGVLLDKPSGIAVVEYFAGLPHEWMKQQLREKVMVLVKAEKAKQLTMGGANDD